MSIHWYHYIAIASLAVFLAICCFHMLRLIYLGKPRDYSNASGNTAASIRYAFTAAMNPAKKESAFLHLPTYTAGIIYHLGTFLSIFLFFLTWFTETSQGMVFPVMAVFLLISVACGIGIFIKRLIKKNLRNLSNPDDYISNILVDLFQFITALFLVYPSVEIAYYLIVSILLLYFPLGKLKHAIYFFAARYHLGFFYGWRGVWPPKQLNRI